MQTIGNQNSRNKRNISISGNLALSLISKSLIINVIGINKLLNLCTVLCVPKWVITWAFRRKHPRCKFGFVFFFFFFFAFRYKTQFHYRSTTVKSVQEALANADIEVTEIHCF